MSYMYMVVYPQNPPTRKVLTITTVVDYEIDQYDLASRQRFDTEESAKAYGKKLAKEHNLEMDWDGSGILDEDE